MHITTATTTKHGCAPTFLCAHTPPLYTDHIPPPVRTLPSTDLSIRFKLGRINEKIDRISRQMQYVETQFKSVEDARLQQ